MERVVRQSDRERSSSSMGNNYKFFRLSDMIPNAWFYKLRDMSLLNPRSSHPIKKRLPASIPRPTPEEPACRSAADKLMIYTNPKASDTHFPDPPRKSSRGVRSRTKRRTIYYKPSFSAANGHEALNSVRPKTIDESFQDDYLFPPKISESDTCSDHEPDLLQSPLSEFDSDDHTNSFNQPTTCSCAVSSSATDIIINMNEKSCSKKIGMISSHNLEVLPPILTEPSKRRDHFPTEIRTCLFNLDVRETEAHGRAQSIKFAKEKDIKADQKDIKTTASTTHAIRKSVGVKLRAAANSPRLASNKKVQVGRRRRSFAESFAVVKSSFDPQKDFRESMMEMIVENNIRRSKDLEHLLACYLSLNSTEYHDLIVKAFEQIWFNM